MDDSDINGKLEFLFSKLLELAAKREEHFQILEKDLVLTRELLDKSEGRIDKTNEAIRMLMVATDKTVKENQQFVRLHCKHKSTMIARYEKKYDELIDQAKEAQKQNTLLIEQLASKDRQILKLESILLSQLSSAKISIGELRNEIASPYGGGGK